MNGIEMLWAPSEITGFLPRGIPPTPADLTALPYPSLRALGIATPALGSLTDDEIETVVAHLPSEPDVTPVDISPLECEAVTRAYVTLAAHLIHRPRFAVRRELPPSVARPLWNFSTYVGRPPSLTYASYVLANFTVPLRPRMPAGELKIAQTPSGTTDEEWFVAVHLSVESAGGEVVNAIFAIDKGLRERDEELILQALESIESCLVFAVSTMPTVLEGVNPEVFRNQIRPLLYGHDRIAFRGVAGDPVVTYIGETGAQSGVIRAIDAVLGVHHSEGITASMNRFLLCAPQIHQKFFAEGYALGKRLRPSLEKKKLREAWQAAVRTLAEFRRTHLQVVSHYLAPDGKPLTKSGTGGTDFQVWLQRLVSETEAAAANPLISYDAATALLDLKTFRAPQVSH